MEDSFKVVDTCNFGGDYPNEKIIAGDIPLEKDAEIIAECFNKRYSGDTAPRFYKVVSSDYKLKGGFEP